MLIAFLAANPLEHIVRHPIIQRDADLGFLTQDGKVTILDTHILMMMLAAVLCWCPPGCAAAGGPTRSAP
jgi:hypothetical protein